MASKNTSSLSPILLFNVLFFTLVTSCSDSPCQRPWPIPEPSPCPGSHGSCPGSFESCPRDALKLGVCTKVLNGLLNATVGTPPTQPCCSLIQGLADLEAAICICTAIKANVLGINLNVPLSLSLLLNVCGCKVPKDFQCN